MHPEPGTWEEFLDKFMSGQGEYNSSFSCDFKTNRVFPPQGNIKFKI